MLIAVALVASAEIAAADAPAARDTTSFGQIRGSVFEGLHRSPIPFCNVIILGTRQGSLTDENGWFQIPHAPAGTYQIKAFQVGYDPRILTVSVRGGETTAVEIALGSHAVSVRDSLDAIGEWPPRLDFTARTRLSRAYRLEVVRLHGFVSGRPWPAQCFEPPHLPRDVAIIWRDSLLAALDVADFARPALGVQTLCECQPEVAVRASGAAGETDLVLCYECETIGVFSSGMRTQTAFFGPARDRFLRFAQAAFPGDSALVSRR